MQQHRCTGTGAIVPSCLCDLCLHVSATCAFMSLRPVPSCLCDLCLHVSATCAFMSLRPVISSVCELITNTDACQSTPLAAWEHGALRTRPCTRNAALCSFALIVVMHSQCSMQQGTDMQKTDTEISLALLLAGTRWGDFGTPQKHVSAYPAYTHACTLSRCVMACWLVATKFRVSLLTCVSHEPMQMSRCCASDSAYQASVARKVR